MRNLLIPMSLAGAFALASLNTSQACSTIMVPQLDSSGKVVNVINARTMDFETQLFYFFGFGAVGTQNTSSVNFYKSLENSDDKIATWTNKHKFVGRSTISKECLVDGINDAGVYAGYLFLPDITEYPEYDPNDSRKALAVLDALNFTLGMAGDVDEAVALLKGYQLVNSAVEFKFGKLEGFTVQPLHLVIRDKSGNAALIEYRDGKPHFHSNKKINVVTNAPFYNWHLRNFDRKSSEFRHRNKPSVREDGLWMNGSGLDGLRGTWMPTDRFVRAKQILKFAPPASSLNEALLVAQQAIGSVSAPLGSTDAPSIFLTIADLRHKKYYYKGITSIMLSDSTGINVLLDPDAGDPGKWITVELDKLNSGNLPKDFLVQQTRRRTRYIDPNSKKVSYAKGVQARTTYVTNFRTLDFFTEEFVEAVLFGGK